MKNTSTLFILVVFAVMFSTVQSVPATEAFEVFEMGESGQTIVFPSKKAATAADSDQNTMPSVRAQTIDNLHDEDLIHYEMGESGQIVSFAMTPEQIATRQAEIEKRSFLRTKYNPSPAAPSLLVFEMGESGQTVTFARDDEAMAADDTVEKELAVFGQAKHPGEK